MRPAPIIVWFRDDLRLSDHPALHAASKTGAPVICLYVLDEQARAARPARGRSAARRAGGWRNRCARLQKTLNAAGTVAGAAPRARRPKSSPIWRARPAPAPCSGTRSRRRRIKPLPKQVEAGARKDRRRLAKLSRAICWCPPPISATRKAGACGYSRRSGGGCRRSGDPPKPLAGAEIAASGRRHRERSARRLASRTQPSRLGRRLARDLDARREPRPRPGSKSFLENGVAGYASDRDRPDRDGTSGLSPHLRFGEISPRQVWHAARFAAAERPALVRRHRQVPQRTRLARILPPSAVRRARPRDTQPATRLRRLPLEARRRGAARPGSAAGPATPSSMPACASSGTPA